MTCSLHTWQRHGTWYSGVLHQKKIIETSGIIKRLVEHVGLEQPTVEGSGELLKGLCKYLMSRIL